MLPIILVGCYQKIALFLGLSRLTIMHTAAKEGLEMKLIKQACGLVKALSENGCVTTECQVSFLVAL